MLETEIGREAAAVGGAVDGEVVQHDRLAVGRQHDVDLDRRRAPILGRLQGRQRVLRVAKAIAPVAADMDVPGLAGKETEGHASLGSFLVGCGDRWRKRLYRVAETRCLANDEVEAEKRTENRRQIGLGVRRSRIETTSLAMRSGSCLSVVSL